MWQYAHSENIATDYDDYFALNQLFEFDEQVIARYLSKPGLVADFGCGTGRALMPLARRGFRTLAVDLSDHMLELVGEKAEVDELEVSARLFFTRSGRSTSTKWVFRFRSFEIQNARLNEIHMSR